MTTPADHEIEIEPGLGPAPKIPEYECLPRSYDCRLGVYGSIPTPRGWSPATSVELHIGADSDFTRKGWGRKVAEAGGHYSEARGASSERFVHLPWPAGRALADRIAVEFRARAIIFRGAINGPLDSVVYSSQRPKDWPMRMGAAEAVYLTEIARAKAKGDLIQVEQDPALRADELVWREHREALATARSAETQIRKLREEITRLQGLLEDCQARTAATTEAAERHERRLSADITPEE